MSIDHDQIFKRLSEAFLREFLALFCLAEAELIGCSQVEYLRQEHFTDVQRGLRRRLDLVAKRAWKVGGEKFVLVHVKLKSKRAERGFPRRMFQYYCQLFLRYNPDILPIAVFSDGTHGRAPVPDHFELSLPGTTGLRLEYLVIKLRHLDYRQFLELHNPPACGLMAKMDDHRAERVRLQADFCAGVRPLPSIRQAGIS